MKKRISAVILMLVCMLVLAPCIAYALNYEPSTLTIVLEYGDEPLEGIKLSVCQVAGIEEENGDIVYRAVPAFSGANADFTDLTTAKNIALAAALDAYAASHSIARNTAVTGSNGGAGFSDLPAGLYLVAQTDSENSEYVIAPYLFSVINTGLDREANMIIYPKTEPTKRTVESNPSSTPSEVSSNPSSTSSEVESTPSSIPSKPVPKGYTGGAKTNDESNLLLWLILLAVSFVGLFIIMIQKKRRDGVRK